MPYCPSCADYKLNELFRTLLTWNNDTVVDLQGQLEKSLALRFITHIIGDIHQPLHACALFDDKLFPKGDEGGNFFKIDFGGERGIDQLHKYFDSGAGKIRDFQRVLFY